MIQNQILNDTDFKKKKEEERIKVCESLNICFSESRFKLHVDSNIYGS